MNKSWAKVFTAATLLAVQAAHAEVVTFEFFGRTTYSNPMAAAGTPVIGRFSWDTAGVPRSSPHDPPNLRQYVAPAVLNMSFRVGAHTVASSRMHVYVWDNVGGNVGDMIDISMLEPVIDGTTFPRGYASMRLASKPENADVLRDTSLPGELDVEKFAYPEMNYFRLYSGGGTYEEMLLDVDVKRIQRVGTPRAAGAVAR